MVKKFIALLLSVAFVFLSVMPAVALEPSETEPTAADRAVLDSVLEYIEQNTTVTAYGDGMEAVSLAPAAAAGVRGLLDGVAAAQQPVAMAAAHDYGYTTGQQHTAIDLEDRYLYSLLDEEHREYYRMIDAAVRGLEESVQCTTRSELFTSGAMYFLYMFDTPELFYLCNTVNALTYTNGDRGYAFCYAVSSTEYCDILSFDRPLNESLRNKIAEKKSAFDSAVADFIATIPADAPDVIKERLIYAKILRASYYNTNAVWDKLADDNWTAYGILCNGYGVCESYAESFQLLCNAVGIRCTGIIGYAGESHKWNAVEIDGEWYQCDITFDDPLGGDPGAAYDTYFNLTSEQMAAGEVPHDWTENPWSEPECTATANGRARFLARYMEDEDGTIHCFADGCDATCENCSVTRETLPHEYAGDCDAACDGCGQTRQATADHIYDNETDATCNRCGNTRHIVLNGWVNEGGKWAYYQNDIKLTDQWKEDSVGWVYLGADGYMLTNQWMRDSVGWCYLGASGYTVAHQWVGDCYINANGYCNGICGICDHIAMTGHLYDNASDADCNSCGYKRTVAVKSGWVKEGSKWAYYKNGAKVKSDWMKDSVGWCYLGADGYMKTNEWVRDSVGWCYVGAGGYCVTSQWVQDSVGWCYLDKNGRMATNQWIKDSVGWCYVGGDGYCVTNCWKKDSVGWCYLDKNGRMATNTWIMDSKGWCYLGADGYAVTNCWKKDSVGWCYLDSEGSMVKNDWVKTDGEWYYLNGSGYRVTGRQTIDGTSYTFDSNGMLI